MPYTLSWYAPGQVLYLGLHGQPTLQELETINQTVVEQMKGCQSKVNILIDATHLQTSYHTADLLRTTQKYMDDPRLDSAFVVAENKLNRLITLMAFSVSRARFVQLNTMEMARSYLQRRGYTAGQDAVNTGQ